MQSRVTKIHWVPALIAIWPITMAFGQAPLLDTVFTYQGRLRNIQNNVALEVTSTCDFQIGLCAAAVGACTLGMQNLPGQPVTGSIFALELDFGANVFDGNERWLEIAVQCPLPPYNDTAFALLPRQRITPAPYALQTRGIFVNESGEVGIGTTNPIAKFEVKGGNLRVVNDGLNGDPQIQTFGPDLNTAGTWAASAGGSLKWITRIQDTGAGVTYALQDREAIGQPGRFFINEGGNVAIGDTANPDHVLDVRGTLAVGKRSGEEGRIDLYGSGGDLRAFFEIVESGTTLAIDADSALIFRPNNTEHVRFTAAGNVGIGTTAPISRLDIRDDSTPGTERTILTLRTAESQLGTGAYLDWAQSGAVSGRIGSVTEAGGQAGLSFHTYDGGLGERLRIRANGNVGIGTTNPTEKLDVNGLTRTTTALRIRNTLDVNKDWQIGEVGGFDADDLNFAPTLGGSGGASVVFKRDGNVGIGTSAPGGKLTINHTGADAIRLERSGRETWSMGPTSSGNAGLRFHNETDALTRLFLAEDGLVGIGTNTPAGVLQIHGSDNQLLLSHTSANRTAALAFNTSAGDPSQGGLTFQRRSTAGAIEANHMTLNLASGDFGIGTIAPTHRLHVRDALAGTAEDLANHVALIENTINDVTDHADVLALRINNSDPRGNNNFITFFDSNSCIGEIQGTDAGGGINFKSSPCDYAEFLPRAETGELIEAGDVVGVFSGKVTRLTTGADGIMVISTSPLILGNMPQSKAAESEYEKVAFIGQVPIKVRGHVRTGDLIVPSGNDDGVGIAVSPSDILPELLSQIVGQAWESSDHPGVKKVNALVGISPTSRGFARVSSAMEQQNNRIRQLEARLATLETKQGECSEVNARLARLEAVLVRNADAGPATEALTSTNDSTTAQTVSGGGR